MRFQPRPRACDPPCRVHCRSSVGLFVDLHLCGQVCQHHSMLATTPTVVCFLSPNCNWSAATRGDRTRAAPGRPRPGARVTPGERVTRCSQSTARPGAAPAEWRPIRGTQGQGSVEIVAYSGSQKAAFLRRTVGGSQTRQSRLGHAKVGNFTSAQLGKITSALTARRRRRSPRRSSPAPRPAAGRRAGSSPGRAGGQSSRRW